MEPDSVKAANPSKHDAQVRRVEIIISNLLRAGVTISILTIMVGMVLTFSHHPEYRSSQDSLRKLLRPGATEFPTSISEVASGLAGFQGRAVVVLGVLLLIVTPILRVLASALAFAYEKDWRFVMITLVVLLFLAISFFVGTVEG